MALDVVSEDLAEPLLAATGQAASLIVVVLPAPFGPRKPKIECCCTVRLRPVKACTPLKALLKLFVSITRELDVFIFICSFLILFALEAIEGEEVKRLIPYRA